MNATTERRHPNFPRYGVSADGTITSYVHKRPRVLRPIQTGKYVGLTILDRDGVIRRIYVHHLVGEVFHGKCPLGMEWRHLDGNRLNNGEANLAHGTRSQNMQDKVLHGTAPIGERHPGAKLNDDAVVAMRRARAAGASLTRLSREFGVSRMTCSRVVNHRLWTHIQESRS